MKEIIGTEINKTPIKKRIARKKIVGIIITAVIICTGLIVIVTNITKTFISNTSGNTPNSTVNPINHNQIYENQKKDFLNIVENSFYSTYESSLLQAQSSAIKKIEALFEGYKENIPILSQELTSFKKRMSLLFKGIQNTFSSDKSRVIDAVQTSFRENIFTEEELSIALQTILNEYQRDIDLARTAFYLSSQNELVKYDHIQSIKYIDLMDIAFSNFKTKIEETSSSNTFFPTDIIFGFLGAVGAHTIATAAGAATGGMLGILPGPIDNLIGIGVGVIVDQIMANNNQDKIEAEYNNILENMKQEIINGTNNTIGFKEQTNRYQIALLDIDLKTINNSIQIQEF